MTVSRDVACVVLSIGLGLGCGGSNKNANGPDGSGAPAEVGKPAPVFAVESVNGKGKIALESLRGKVVVVDFWATWCGPCKQSFPKLEELSKKIGDRVEVVGISVDDEKGGVAAFAKENGATFSIGWDEGHSIASRWKVGTMPTTFVVDAAGTVRHIHDGYRDGETKQMEKEIAALLDEASASGRAAKSEPAADVKAEEPAAAPPADTPTDAAAAPAAEDEKPEPTPAKKKPAKKGGKPAPKKPAPAKKK